MSAVQVASPEDIKTGEERLRVVGTFVSRELEQQYRRSLLKANLSTAAIIFIVNTIGVLVFIPADYRLFGSEMPFPLLLGLRLGICALTALVWVKLRATVQTLHPPRFDRWLLLWSIVIAAAQVYVSFTRPASYTGHFLVHLFTVLLTYCVLPAPLLLQAVPALIMSVGMVVCITVKLPADGLTSSALVWTLLAGNVLGASISRQLHLSGRLQFLALQRETQVRQGLESALAELKTLRGIIPICAHCKNIRDDAGSWQGLEEYISEHSDAEFSHGICPTCVEKYFP